MGTIFECLHRALEDKNVGSVNTDIGAEFYSVGPQPSTSRTKVRRPITLTGSGLTTIKSAKKIKSRMFFIVLYSGLKKMKT